MTLTLNVTDSPAWADSSDPAWLLLGARLAAYLHPLATRTDLLVRVTVDDPDAPAPAKVPAGAFVPSQAEIRLHANQLWPADRFDPDRFDPATHTDRAEFPEGIGVVTHEAAHAAHTRLDLTGATAAAAHFATLLEEPRIEARMLTRFPAQRGYLRASASAIIADGALTMPGGASGRYAAMRSAILLLGRAHAGVFDAHEVTDLRAQVVAELGTDDADALDALLAEAVQVDDGDNAGIVELAQRCVTLLGEEPPTPDSAPQSGDAAPQGGDGQPHGGDDAGDGGDSDSDGGGVDEPGPAHQMPCGAWTGGEIPDGVDPWRHPDTDAEDDEDAPEVAHVAASIARQISSDTRDQAAAAAGIITPSRKDTTADRLDQMERESLAAALFGAGAGEASANIDRLTPTDSARGQARTLTARLRTASYRGVARTRVATVAPPGRMRTSQVMAQDAQREMGQKVTAQAFGRTRRRVTQRPPLIVGIAADVSGTMSAWQTPTGELTWALAQAVKGMHGQVAAVAWDGGVYPTLHPRTAPAYMPVGRNGAASSACPAAVRALDGQLRLAGTEVGARVLVVITDGLLPNLPAVARELDRLVKAGVRVLWVRPQAGSLPLPVPGVRDIPLTNLAEFAPTLGDSLTAALSEA